MNEPVRNHRKKTSPREYYYTTWVPRANYRTDEEPIVVNCADFSNKTSPFTTRIPEGRLDISICYIAEGELFFQIGNSEKQIAKGGTVVVILPRVPVTYGYDGTADPPVRRSYWLHFTGSYALKLLKICGFERGGLFSLPDESGGTAAFTALLDEMRHPPTPLTRTRAAAAAVSLLTQFGRSIERGEEKRRLPKSIAYIREHFAEEIDKHALAAMDGLSQSHYRTLFRRVMGRTPAAYITLLRIEKARRLLMDPDMPIAEVAHECGYEDPLYFSRVFSRMIGVSPSEYRRHGGEG